LWPWCEPVGSKSWGEAGERVLLGMNGNWKRERMTEVLWEEVTRDWNAAVGNRYCRHAPHIRLVRYF